MQPPLQTRPALPSSLTIGSTGLPDRGDTFASVLARRAVVSGATGALATGSRTAAAIGAGILLRGGNAFDAGLAAALAETVLLPSKCGFAGDLVALYVRAGDPAPTSIVAIGPAAARLPDAAAANGWRTPLIGGLSVGVPGAPAGYAALADLGRLSRSEVAAPATALARNGIVWNEFSRRLALEADATLMDAQLAGCVYRPVDAPLATGTRLRLPGLARLLDGFVDRGSAVLHGELGEQIVAYVQSHGGVLSTADLQAAPALRAPALKTEVAGRALWTTPAPTYGPALADCLREWNATRPAGQTLTPEAVVGRVRALRSPRGLRDEGTSTIAAVDRDGNAVVIVHSNSFPQFGSGLVVPGLDLVLSNRAGRGFTWEPGHPNAPEAGRRPLTTLHAWGFRDESGTAEPSPAATPAADETTGGGWVLGATPGGESQVPWNAQLLDRLLRRAAPGDLGAAMVAGKWDFDATDTWQADGVTRPELSARSSHTVVRFGADGSLHAAADPRLDGAAVGA